MTDFVEAEAGIRQLHARYIDAVWRKDLDAFGDCLTEDSEWRIGGAVLNGRANIVAHFGNILPRFQRILMTFRPAILDVGDGVATGRTYVTEQSVLADGRPFFAIGIYFERFVLQGTRWRAGWRLFQTQYAGPPDFSAPFIDTVDFGAPPAMPALDQPTQPFSLKKE